MLRESVFGGVNRNRSLDHPAMGRAIGPRPATASATGDDADTTEDQEHADDLVLLGRFVSTCCEDAFTELVRRHINLVHSTASRILGDPALAEDVAQTVFLDLALKAKTLQRHVFLAGWLYRSTCFAAFNLLRGERRRLKREVEAAKITQVRSEGRSIWESHVTLLEDAVEQLRHTDQKAVQLRFVEGRSLCETGQFLGLSEDTAQKRIARAVERLRRYFIARGIATPQRSMERNAAIVLRLA